MDHEMESMDSYSVLCLVEAPRGVKLIGNKLIYKKKCDAPKPGVPLTTRQSAEY